MFAQVLLKQLQEPLPLQKKKKTQPIEKQAVSYYYGMFLLSSAAFDVLHSR